jgi:hypothetical protein
MQSKFEADFQMTVSEIRMFGPFHYMAQPIKEQYDDKRIAIASASPYMSDLLPRTHAHQ